MLWFIWITCNPDINLGQLIISNLSLKNIKNRVHGLLPKSFAKLHSSARGRVCIFKITDTSTKLQILGLDSSHRHKAFAWHAADPKSTTSGTTYVPPSTIRSYFPEHRVEVAPEHL